MAEPAGRAEPTGRAGRAGLAESAEGVGRVALRYRLDGPPGAPVVALGPSLGTTHGVWQPQMAALTERFAVLRYDHRGHDATPAPPGPYRIEKLAADLVALLDTLGLDRVHLGGVSLGGMLAMSVAARAPHRVDRLALVCTSARHAPPEAWRERAATVRAGGTAAVADAVVARWFTPAFAERHPAVAGWARGMLLRTNAEGYAGCCEAIAAMDLVPALGRIEAPTLVIAGADDPATPVEHAEVIANGIAGARLEVVDSAAHLAGVEQPERVSTLLSDFLEGAHGEP